MSTPRKGVFISFEGGEATGKTTQISMLSEFLKHSAIPHVVTREPGGCLQSEMIRKLFLDPDLQGWSLWSQYFLLLASRNEHIHSVILPALNDGKWVLCDRFQDSSRVYQGIVGGLGLDVVDEIYAKTIGDVWPNLTFVLEISEELMLQRLDARDKEKDRFDKLPLAFHKRIREAFQGLCLEAEARMMRVDTKESSHETHTYLVDILQVRFPQLKEAPVPLPKKRADV
ncbi:MAG: dTMP kinase [Alphaproteobacteria bacterium]|nr:MAG: dTMP kinase [Alphaproteobacteria bacterium]